MILSKEQLINLEPKINHVLLKQHSDNSLVKFNETYLKIDTSWKPEYHVDRVFTVVRTPDKLIMKPGFEHSMQWETDMELREGDLVWINYLQPLISKFKFECEGEKYILVHYQFIYLAVRRWNPEDHGLYYVVKQEDPFLISKDGASIIHTPSQKVQVRLQDENSNIVPIPPNIIQDTTNIVNERVQQWEAGRFAKSTYLCQVLMLNGYILLESERDTARRDLVWVRRRRNRMGILRFYGRPNRRYKDVDSWDDNYLSSPGQIVLLRFNEYKQLEDPIHRLFPWPEPLIVTQRRHCSCVLYQDAEPIKLENDVYPV